MYRSRMFPVKLFSENNGCIYSETMKYPISLLRQAKDYLTGKPVANVMRKDNGMIGFISDPGYSWSLPNIVEAYNCYDNGIKSGVSFYPICDLDGVEQLYVSSVITSGKGVTSRLLVNTYTMDTVNICRNSLMKRLSRMIDKKFSITHLMDLFYYARCVEGNLQIFEDAILVDLGSDSYMAFSSLGSPYWDLDTIYGFTDIEMIRKLLEGTPISDKYIINGNAIQNKYVLGSRCMPMEWAKRVVSVYDALIEVNHFYKGLDSDNAETLCYVSNDFNYVVHATTFEKRKITNIAVQGTFRNALQKGSMSADSFAVLWQCLRGFQ